MCEINFNVEKEGKIIIIICCKHEWISLPRISGILWRPSDILTYTYPCHNHWIVPYGLNVQSVNTLTHFVIKVQKQNYDGGESVKQWNMMGGWAFKNFYRNKNNIPKYSYKRSIVMKKKIIKNNFKLIIRKAGARLI